MHLNPHDQGQVLLFPYYTVNGGNQTLITLSNNTDRGKALKVRFREGVSAREVANLKRSPGHPQECAAHTA